MLAVRFVHHANSHNVLVLNLTIHDSFYQMMPVLVQQASWEVMLGVELAFAMLVTPAWLRSFFEETVLHVHLWCQLMMAGLILQEEVLGRKRQVAQISRDAGLFWIMREEMGDLAGVIHPLLIVLDVSRQVVLPQDPFNSAFGCIPPSGRFQFCFFFHRGHRLVL